MTNKEAKKIIFNQWQTFLDNYIDFAGISEAYKLAIKALEQEPVFDEIRAEIYKHKLTIDKAISEDELKIEGMKEAYTDCLEIIDKYMVESEDKK